MFIKTISQISDFITSTEDLYSKNLTKRLNNPLLHATTYWSILKTVYNDRKIPIIPLPLIDKFVTDIQTKSNIFDKFFTYQCTPMTNFQ